MKALKRTKIVSVILCLTVFLNSHAAANLIGPEVTIDKSGEVIVNTYFHNTEDFETSIRTGITKDITITVIVKKIKDFWPDELVKMKKFERSIHYNTLKETFTVTLSDGEVTETEIFKDYLHMVKSTLMIKDLHMVNTNDLPQGQYFVTVIMESHRIKLPPVIRHLLFFVPEKEFTIQRKSTPFVVKK
jgi:hypothetical protein